MRGDAADKCTTDANYGCDLAGCARSRVADLEGVVADGTDGGCRRRSGLPQGGCGRALRRRCRVHHQVWVVHRLHEVVPYRCLQNNHIQNTRIVKLQACRDSSFNCQSTDETGTPAHHNSPGFAKVRTLPSWLVCFYAGDAEFVPWPKHTRTECTCRSRMSRSKMWA